MMNFLGVVTLSMLCLTLSATSASAECAWVSWLEQTTVAGDASKREWNTIVGVPTNGECEKALDETVRGARIPPPGETADQVERNVIIRQGEKGKKLPKLALRYICLPDSVDPRGPR